MACVCRYIYALITYSVVTNRKIWPKWSSIYQTLWKISVSSEKVMCYISHIKKHITKQLIIKSSIHESPKIDYNNSTPTLFVFYDLHGHCNFKNIYSGNPLDISFWKMKTWEDSDCEKNEIRNKNVLLRILCIKKTSSLCLLLKFCAIQNILTVSILFLNIFPHHRNTLRFF